jgi:hypothetical protein
MKELSRITETFGESVIREMTRICNAAEGYTPFKYRNCHPERKPKDLEESLTLRMTGWINVLTLTVYR